MVTEDVNRAFKIVSLTAYFILTVQLREVGSSAMRWSELNSASGRVAVLLSQQMMGITPVVAFPFVPIVAIMLCVAWLVYRRGL